MSAVVVLGTKRADELRPGDRVLFRGSGLVKKVHDVQYLRPGHRVSYDIGLDTETRYPLEGTLVHWYAPHNKVNWFTACSTKLEIVQ